MIFWKSSILNGNDQYEIGIGHYATGKTGSHNDSNCEIIMISISAIIKPVPGASKPFYRYHDKFSWCIFEDFWKNFLSFFEIFLSFCGIESIDSNLLSMKYAEKCFSLNVSESVIRIT